MPMLEANQGSPVVVTFRFKETTLLMVGDCRLFFVDVDVVVGDERRNGNECDSSSSRADWGNRRMAPFPDCRNVPRMKIDNCLSAGAAAAANSFVGHFGEEKRDNYGCGQVDEWKWSTSRRRRSSRYRRRRQRPSHKLFAKSDKMDVKTTLVGVDIDVFDWIANGKVVKGSKT